MKNWNSTEVVKASDLHENYWYQGFFYTGFGQKEYYRRDFEEIRFRDLALFTLGGIEGKKVLDIGCGNGLYSLTFLKMGAELVAGQDLSQKYLDIGTDTFKKNGYSNFVMKAGNCEFLQYEDNYFDSAFSGDVFEHITREQKINFINETFRVLKPGGRFTIKTPNKSYLKMSNFFRRILALAKFKNPMNIHIAHTHNNPDNEHHGLTTHAEMLEIFGNTMFHKPEIVFQELNKKSIPNFIRRLFKKNVYFNQQIIISVQKPIFYGIYK